MRGPLVPLLNAKETKFFKDGDKRVDVAALAIRVTALENAFKLRGSYEIQLKPRSTESR